jgi:hypothetical protein
VASNIGHSQAETPPPGLTKSVVGYMNGLQSYGYLRITVSAQTLTLTFVRLQGRQPTDFETVSIDLASHGLVFP